MSWASLKISFCNFQLTLPSKLCQRLQRNNTFGATAFTSYAAFWIAFALLVTFNVGGIPPEARPAAVGTFLLAWGIFTAYMTVAAIITAIGAWYVSAITVIASTRKH